MTPPRISDVDRWEPESLRTTMIELAEIVEKVKAERAGVLEEQDVLGESWNGDAAVAAASRTVGECSRMGEVAGSLEKLAGAFDGAAAMVEGAKNHVDLVVSAAEQSGFDVADDGVVSADRAVASLPSGDNNPGAAQLRSVAVELTDDIKGALAQAESAALDAAARIDGATDELASFALRNPAGQLVQRPDGGISWVPDAAGTVAAGIVESASKFIGNELKNAAIESVDDIAKDIGKAVGPFGVVLTSVMSVKEDIDAGMDPTKAIVTEGGGVVTGIAAGAALGSVVPGIGTVGGAVVGAVVGGGVGHLTTEWMRSWW